MIDAIARPGFTTNRSLQPRSEGLERGPFQSRCSGWVVSFLAAVCL